MKLSSLYLLIDQIADELGTDFDVATKFRVGEMILDTIDREINEAVGLRLRSIEPIFEITEAGRQALEQLA